MVGVGMFWCCGFWLCDGFCECIVDWVILVVLVYLCGGDGFVGVM